jgi:hypothetical protein
VRASATASPLPDEAAEVPVASGHRLKTGAIGLVGVLFMATANAAER